MIGAMIWGGGLLVEKRQPVLIDLSAESGIPSSVFVL